MKRKWKPYSLVLTAFVVVTAAGLSAAQSAATATPALTDQGGKLDVKGFGKTRWGMTPDEILESADGRVVPATKKERTAYGGVIVPLVIRGHEYGGHIVDVHFQVRLDTNTLERVRLQVKRRRLATVWWMSSKIADIHQRDLAFADLTAHLRANYGDPTARRNDDVRQFERWIFDTTNIVVSRRGPPLLSIVDVVFSESQSDGGRRTRLADVVEAWKDDRRR